MVLTLQVFKGNARNSAIKRCMTILLMILMVNFLGIDKANAQKGQAFTLEINGIIKDDDNGRSIDGAIVKVTTVSGQTVQSSTTTGNGKFKFILEPNKEYLITASKPGYTGKIVSVNTKDVDVNSGTLDYYKFPISISIFKEVPDLDVSVLKSPIGSIFYNQTLKDFDYTADKFQREAMEKMVKELEKKKKEDVEKKTKEDNELKDKAKNEAKQKAEAEAAARKKAEEEAKRKLADSEEAKKKQAADAKKAAEEEIKRRAKESAEEAEARKKSEAEAKRLAEEEAKNKAKAEAEARAEEELKKREEAKKKAEEEAKIRAEAKALEMEKRKEEAEARRLAAEEAKKIYVKNIDYETQEGTNFNITKTIITTLKDEKVEYKKIIYSWGGVYYKKDTSDITEESFITDLKNVILKTE